MNEFLSQGALALEVALLTAVDLAELGIWSIDLLENKVLLASRMSDWHGLPSKISLETFRSVIDPADLRSVDHALHEIVRSPLSYRFDVRYFVVNLSTGVRSHLHAVGKCIFNDENIPVAIHGVAQDVTTETSATDALEVKMHQYSGDLVIANNNLAAVNQQLAASIEDLACSNEELANANSDLLRSNEELSQYAHIASHDLQEPLRKIRTYAGYLREETGLSEEGHDMIDKINISTKRMTLLISDLLVFSGLTKEDSELTDHVSLNETVRQVIFELDTVILEKSALVTTDSLPIIQGASTQMIQLFLNLLSNALKFSDLSRPPKISISSRKLGNEEVRLLIRKPIEEVAYHQITISDNGIGFDDRFSEQIFEIFKRLHNRNAYPGTGIGLAICKRVIVNHKGTISAISRPGEGSDFTIILPERQ